MTKVHLYMAIARSLGAMENCLKTNNTHWHVRHEQDAIDLVRAHMPHGSGIDNSTKIDLERSDPNRLVFSFGYHHMNEAGMYDGWTDHEAIVTPCLSFGFSLRITGRDKNQIKDYLHYVFQTALETDVDEYPNRADNQKTD